MPHLIVTNSSLSTFRACPRLYQLKYVDGYRPVENGEDLELGSAMHHALEIWWTDGDYDKAAAILTAELEGVALSRATVLLAGYHHRWVDDRDLYEVLALEAPFSFRTPGMHGVRCAGKIDGIVRKKADGTVWLVEHKTFGGDLAPGGTYWQRLGMDSQISMYFDGSAALGYDVAGIIYDVIGKPEQRPLKATPVESRKFTKDGRLYANQREADETLTEYEQRICEKIIEHPEDYYQRTELVRFGNELADARADVVSTTRLMRSGYAPRNVDSCFKYGAGKPCPFASVCAGTESIDDETKFRRIDDLHPELST